MKYVLKNKLIIKKPKKRIIKYIQEHFRFDNPKYVEAVKHGRFIPSSMQRYIDLYNITGNRITVPKASVAELCRVCAVDQRDVIDKTIAPKLNVEFNGVLRDYQEKAVQQMCSRRFGILQASTGAGKTVMACAIVAQRSTTALIIVHSTELQQQWIRALSTFTSLKNVEIGTLGGGQPMIRPVTVGIINSVTKNINELKDYFGILILDECHRAMGASWLNVINTSYCKYQVGLSATPYRSDKTTSALFKVVGPIIHKVDKTHLEDTGAVLKPKIINVSTKFVYTFQNDYSTMLTKLSKDLLRNQLVATTVIKDYKKYGELQMVVSDRVEHCETLKTLIEERSGLKVLVLSSKLSKKERKQKLELLKNGRFTTLISTVALLGEGFDVPELNALFIATPVKFSGRLIQVVGRICRPSDSTQPRLYDFKDILVPVLRYSGFARNRVYKQMKWI